MFETAILDSGLLKATPRFLALDKSMILVDRLAQPLFGTQRSELRH